MSAPLTPDPEYLVFLEGQRDEYLLREAEIKAQYQDYCDGLREAYLDEIGE